MAKKATVNKSLCISCGACVSLCPDCFKFGEDGKSEFIQGCDSSTCYVEVAAETCPTAAIEVTE